MCRLVLECADYHVTNVQACIGHDVCMDVSVDRWSRGSDITGADYAPYDVHVYYVAVVVIL